MLLSLPGVNPATATPLLALKETDNCGGCHKPGRPQRNLIWRRCTLDCQGCHIDPAGGGPRSQWGYYYSQDQLAMVNFFKPQDPLDDKSRFDLHYDGRVIQRVTSESDRTFPMSSEFSVRVRPFVEYLHLTYQGLMLGRIGDQSLRATRDDPRRYREKYSVMIDQLPLGVYGRAYRGPPMYGIRRSNHSLWIRERIGLDQFATTEATEVGGTPNVPFMRASMMNGDPYAEPEDRQKGTSFHGGLRGVSFGWHLNGSTWDTESEKAKVSMRALGAGASPWDFIFYGERNWRQVDVFDEPVGADQFASHANRLHPSSEITEWTMAWAGIPGIMPGFVQEEIHDENMDGLRRNVFIDFHPIPFVQFEIWRRFESGHRRLIDTLAVLHLYADF
jgi:hypothetical protein